MFKSSNSLPIPKYKRNTCYTTHSGNTIKILGSVYAFKKKRDSDELVKFSTSKRQSLPGILERNYGITPDVYVHNIFILYTGEGFGPDGSRITHGTGPSGEPVPFNPYYKEPELDDMISDSIPSTLGVKSPFYKVGEYSIPYDKYHLVFNKESFFRSIGVSSKDSTSYTVGVPIPISITKQFYVVKNPQRKGSWFYQRLRLLI